MYRSAPFWLMAFVAMAHGNAQSMTLSVSSEQFVVTTTFSEVDIFTINIEIDAPLAPGIYSNPDIVTLSYRVTGELAEGTPSEFPRFDLNRTITGEEFYAQGSSLTFEIAQSAVLEDGVQVAELVGNEVVLSFNAREIDNGRFHPALLELNSDGSGRIQNSDNVPSQDPLQTVEFGAEYITDLMFDPGNTTVLVATPTKTKSDSGALSPLFLCFIALSGLCTRLFRRRR